MPRGGKRAGAGRPKEEPTTVIRVPISELSRIQAIKEGASYRLPVFLSKVQAGFPSPADDYIESTLDLNERCILHPHATFFVVAQGESMKEAGISSGDLLIVDRSVKAAHGHIVIAAINGELTVKRLYTLGGVVKLLPANPDYSDIDITEGFDLIIWGVVKHVVKDL